MPLVGLAIVSVMVIGGIAAYLITRPEPPSAPAIAPKRLVIKTVQKDAAPSTDVVTDAATSQGDRSPTDAGALS